MANDTAKLNIPPISAETLKLIIDAFDALPKSAFLPAEPGVYPAPRPEVYPWFRILEETGFVFSFDWPDWLPNQKLEHPNDPSVLKDASLETLRRLMSAHLRLERFGPGHLRELFSSGYMSQFVDRLRSLARIA
jgi:hypothetical protein